MPAKRPVECAVLRNGKDIRITRGVHEESLLASAVRYLRRVQEAGLVTVASNLNTGALVFEATYKKARKGDPFIEVHWFSR